MKNRNIIRSIAFVLMLVMTISVFVACNKTPDTPADSDPAETTKAPETTAHVHDYGEPVQTKAPTCTEFGEKTATCACGKTVVSSVPALGHTFENYQVLKAATCTEKGTQKGTCACGATEEKDIEALGHDYENGVCKRCQKAQPHNHTFTNNVCTVCGSKAFTNAANDYGVTGALELNSVFDGDKSGANDKFYFSSTLPSKFTGTGVLTLASGDYDKTASNSPSSNTTGYANLPHYYITEGTDQTLVYKVTVTEGGIYDMAIHLRFKDNKERGNTFTVNPGTDYEYTFSTSFEPTTEQVNATKSTDGKDSVYMYGMQIALREGENIIKIADAGCAKCQHYRHFYFVLAKADAAEHVHTFTNNACTCGVKAFANAANNYGLTGAVEKASVYDGNKDGTNDKFYFAPTLASKFTATGAIHINAANYDTTLSASPSSSTSKNIKHFYVTENADPAQCIVYKVTVSEAGLYDMAIHMRLKDNKERGTLYTVNDGTASEYSFETSFQPTDDAEIATMRNADTESSYMYGMQIYLNEGDNYIMIEQSSTSPKCQHYRDLYFVKAA